jgi:hypothetical protein
VLSKKLTGITVADIAGIAAKPPLSRGWKMRQNVKQSGY